MDTLIEIIKIVLMVTGAATWLLAALIIGFYWLCQIPPRD